MNTINPTRGQVERTLSQRIQALYRNQLGHQPSQVTCRLFADKLAIVAEDSITPAEQLLAQEGQEQLAQKVRSGLDEVTKPQLKALIEEILAVSVTDLLSDATLETGRIGMIAILASPPEVRNPNS
ncbi:MAG TPA: hypothetical protein DDZ80_21100 [Cyanobacteria bacterium UBA8803]|nr:hypothetical protein [Cyanobacteria bacterium UBA9273]HBL60840.1 hypothetical protein [Cyanobacteria bacterium UBA8803]